MPSCRSADRAAAGEIAVRYAADAAKELSRSLVYYLTQMVLDKQLCATLGPKFVSELSNLTQSTINGERAVLHVFLGVASL